MNPEPFTHTAARMTTVLRALRALPVTLAWLADEKKALDARMAACLIAAPDSDAAKAEREAMEAQLGRAAVHLLELPSPALTKDFSALGAMQCVFPYQTTALREVLAEVEPTFRHCFDHQADRASFLALLPAAARLHLIVSLLVSFAENFQKHFADYTPDRRIASP